MPVQEKKIDSTLGILPDELLDKVMQKYDITRWQILPFFSLNETILDLNRRTETSRKVLIKHKNQVFFLKEVPWYCAEKKFVSYEFAFQQYLHHCGFPIPTIQKTSDGNLFVELKDEKKFYFLQDFVNGISWSRDSTQTENAGNALAKLHHFSARFLKKTHFCEKPPRENIFSLAQKMLDLVKRILKRSGKIYTMNDFCNYYSYSTRILKSAKKLAYEKGYGKTLLPVHGDYNPFNMLFKKKTHEVIAVFDFDNSCLDDPVHDLAEGLVRFSLIKYKHLSSHYQKPPSNFDKKLFYAFLDGYAKFDRNKILNNLMPYLAEAIAAITIELSAIGLLCGYYSQTDIPRLLNTNSEIKLKTERLICANYL
ncbi:MAG: phosphotransferase [Candidatus Woesearchaeota archaeon]